jgi:hypothetical protein
VADLKLNNVWGKSFHQGYMRGFGREPMEDRDLQFVLYKDKCDEPAGVIVGSPDFSKEISIPAGQRLYVKASGYSSGRSTFFKQSSTVAKICRVPLSFEPEANAQYELEFDQNGGRCFANIYKRVFDGTQTTLKKDRSAKREKLCPEPMLNLGGGKYK